MGHGNKDQERGNYKGWIEGVHPTYLPFDMMTPWLCERLVVKYEDKSMKMPEFMNKKNES